MVEETQRCRVQGPQYWWDQRGILYRGCYAGTAVNRSTTVNMVTIWQSINQSINQSIKDWRDCLSSRATSRLIVWYVSRHCMISVWQVISLCVDASPCNDLSVVLRRVRNCLCIIIIRNAGSDDNVWIWFSEESGFKLLTEGLCENTTC